jgi:hypothetical protein
VLAELQIDDLLAQLQQAQIDLDVAKADLDKKPASSTSLMSSAPKPK